MELLLLLELLLVLLQELLVLLLDHQLLQGQGLSVGLRRAPLRQRGRLGPPQGPVLPLQLGHGRCRRHGQAAYAWGEEGEAEWGKGETQDESGVALFARYLEASKLHKNARTEDALLVCHMLCA